MATSKTKQLNWSKRPYVLESDAGRQRMWSARLDGGDRYTVSELSPLGYPVYFMACFHCERFDSIRKRQVFQVLKLSGDKRLRTRAAAQRLCQQHFRKQALLSAKPPPKRKRSS